MSGDQRFLFDDDEPESWGSIREKAQHEAKGRRAHADHEFRQASAYAMAHGFELVRHTDAHYKVKTPHFLLEVYPGNQRVYRHNDETPYIPMPRPWGLMDVVKGVAKILGDLPPVTPRATEATKSDVTVGMEEFKQASIRASQYGFALYKTGGVYSIRISKSRKGWQIIVDPVKRTITRVDNKGPHPEVEDDWTLMDVVEAVHRRLESHGYKPSPKE